MTVSRNPSFARRPKRTLRISAEGGFLPLAHPPASSGMSRRLEMARTRPAPTEIFVATGVRSEWLASLTPSDQLKEWEQPPGRAK
jgi:hypothetical protein